jgi:transcription factor IIIB 90 kDa subunit
LRKENEKDSKGFDQKLKRPRVKKPKNLTPVNNAQEAIERMISEKKLSSKINYDVLNNLSKDLVS